MNKTAAAPCSDECRLTASDVKVKRGAGEDLEVEEGASRLRINCEKVKADTRSRQLARCHAVQRVNLAVAEILRWNSDTLGEPG